MSKKKKDIDESFYALKYPDYYTWRDMNTVRDGYWPDGQPVRFSDPEMKPFMDEMRQKIIDDPNFARDLLKGLQ